MSLVIERPSTAARVADVLRQQLLSGHVAPGTPLRDTEISVQAGVSRTTVREALSLLVREGLLTHSLHRGTEVTRLAPADIHDIYAMRRVVELAGARALLAARIDALEEQERAVWVMAAAARGRDWRQLVEADVAFHTAMANSLQSGRLRAALAGALQELRLVLSVTDRADDDLDAQLRQHRTLLDLFRERSPQAVRALDAHLAASEAMVCAAVEAQGRLRDAVPGDTAPDARRYPGLGTRTQEGE
jgi:DNA-binding GntR family transcriptional regulator